MAIRGDLLSVDLSNVFQMLAMNRKRGILYIQNRENILEKRALVLDADRVALLEIPEKSDLTGLLVDLGILGYEDYIEARNKAGQFAVSPNDYVTKRNIVSEDSLRSAESRLHEELILEIFLWKNVAFSLDEESFPDPDPKRHEFVLDLMVMEAARRQDEWLRVVELIGGARDIWKPVGSPAADVVGALQPVDRIVYEHVDGVRGTAEVMKDAGLPRYHVDLAIYNLHEVGLVRRMELGDLTEVGDRLMDVGMTSDAIRLFKCAVRQDRRSITLHKRLAAAYLKEGRVAKAAAHYKFCAMTLLDKGLAREALVIYQYVTELLPTDFRALEKTLEIIARLEEPLTREDRDNVRRGIRLSSFYCDSKLYPEAERVLRSLLSIDPSDTSLGFTLARVYARTGRIHDAVELYMKLAGRLCDQRDYDGAINAYKTVISFETENKAICQRKIAQIREMLERRHRRRVAGVLFALTAVISVVLFAGYVVYQKRARSALTEVERLQGEATTEAGWRSLAAQYKDVARSFPVTPAAKRAAELQDYAESRVAELRHRTQAEAEAEQERRAARIGSAGDHMRRAEHLQRDRYLVDALAEYQAALDCAEDADNRAWAEAPDRQLPKRIADLRRHVEAEKERLAEMKEHFDGGRMKEAFEVARSMMDTSTSIMVDEGEIKVLGHRARQALRFPFIVKASPAGALIEVDGSPMPADDPYVVLSEARPRAEVKVAREGYRSRTETLRWDTGGHTQWIVLERVPDRAVSVGDRVRALAPDGGDGIACLCDNGSVLFLEHLTARPKKVEPDAFLTVSTDAVLDGDHLIFGTNDGQVRAVARSARKWAWQRRVGSEPIRDLAVAGRRLVAAAADGRVHVLRLSDGGTERVVTLARPAEAVAGGSAGIVVVGAMGVLSFVDPASGRTVATHPGPYLPVLAVRDRSAFVAARGGSLEVFDLKSGRRIETKPLPSPVRSGPHAVGRRIVAGLADGRLAVIEAAGHLSLLADLPLDAFARMQPRVQDIGANEMLLATDDRKIYRVDLAAGRVRCSYASEEGHPGVGTRVGDRVIIGYSHVDGVVESFSD